MKFEKEYNDFVHQSPDYWDQIQAKIEKKEKVIDMTEKKEEMKKENESKPVNRRNRFLIGGASVAAACLCLGCFGYSLVGTLTDSASETASSVASGMADGSTRNDSMFDADSVTNSKSDGSLRSDGLDYSHLYEDVAPSMVEEEEAVIDYDWTQTTDQYDEITESEFFLTKTDPLSTFSADVDTASYGNLRNMISQGYTLYDIPNDSIRIEEMLNYFDYDLTKASDGERFGTTVKIGDCPWNSSHKLMMIGKKAVEIEDNDAPENLTFLIDVSGSMTESIDLLKSGFKMLVNELDEDDRVSIVTYANGVDTVLDSVSGGKKKQILAAIDGLTTGGGTNGSDGIQRAYKLAEKNFSKEGNNRIILATDGDLNIGISDPDQLQKMIELKRDKGIFLTVLGFDNWNYHDANLERLADYGNGNYYYVGTEMEAKKILVDDLLENLHTVAKDVKFQVEFNPAVVNSYHLIGYDNRMLQAQDFKDDTKDAGEVGAGSDVIVLYELVMADSDSSVDLKYQSETPDGSADEICTVKTRYKEPDGNTSTEEEFVVGTDLIGETNDDFEFASAVAETGLLLRNSKYKGSADLKTAVARADKFAGDDPYKQDFVAMMNSFIRNTEQAAEYNDYDDYDDDIYDDDYDDYESDDDYEKEPVVNDDYEISGDTFAPNMPTDNTDGSVRTDYEWN